MKETGLTIWDWKEQVDVDELNTLLKRAGFKGSINAVTTDDDQNAIIVSPDEITDEQAQEFYEVEYELDGIPEVDETIMDGLGYNE